MESRTFSPFFETTGHVSNMSHELNSTHGRSLDFMMHTTETDSPTTSSVGEQFGPTATMLDHPKRTDLQTALDCGLVPVLSLFGVVGNCLCAIVICRQRYHSVARPLLLALCVANILFLLSTLLISLPCIVCKMNEDSGYWLHVHFMPQLDVFRQVMQEVTVVVTVAIGVERSVAVTRPLKVRGLCTVPRTRSAVLVIFLCVLALQSPAFFRCDVSRAVTPNNVTMVRLHHTSFYLSNKTALDFYFDYFLLVILQGLPFLSMSVCFIIVLVNLKRRLQCACPRTPKFGAFSRARGKRIGNTGDTEHADLVLEEKKLTKALLVVILLCVLSELFSLVVNLLHITQPRNQSRALKVSRDVSRLVCVLNSAITFVVFMMLYKPFSVTFKILIGLCN